MHVVANDVAKKVAEGLRGATYSRDMTLDARFREPMIGWRRPDEQQMAWAKKTIEANPSVPGKADLSLIYAQRAMRLAEYPETMPMPLQVLRIGQVCIGTMPNEVFTEIGLEFKRRSPLADSFMVSLSHGDYGYLPTPRQHELGGYETWLGTSRLEKDASVKMLSELLEMAGDLKSEQATAR
jgi:hypothetical protein